MPHALHIVLDGGPERFWAEGESHDKRSVFIGRNLDRGVLLAGLRSWIVSPAHSASWLLNG